MKDYEARWGRILLVLIMGLSLFVLGCGIKQLTTEVREDGSGRNIFIFAVDKEESGTEEAAEQEGDLEEWRADAEACGARTLPYADERYRGNQAIFEFQSFSEVPGQISCLVGDTTNLQLEGRYEEGTLKKVYQLQARLVPSLLWYSEEEPMLYRVIMPGRIVAYDDLQTAEVRTVKDSGNQVSWYFSLAEEETEYTLTVRAEKSMVPATDWLAYGGIFLLGAVLVAAIGFVVWKMVGAAAGPQTKGGDGGAKPGTVRRSRPGEVPPSAAPVARRGEYPAPGSILDRYEIREELGRGGMAAVYRARHRALQRDVALKILAPWLTDTPDFVKRFRQEGQILARLAHPHIVTVHDAGSAQGYYYLAMELVRGRSLDRALQQWGRLDPRHAVAIAQQIAQALDYAHRQGIVHRDIKPANILLDEEGRAKVADFGIVAILGENQVAHTRIGTPRYMAYEHYSGTAVPQSDLYSLGACLYEMLTGRCPPAFGLETPIPPSQFNRAISPALDHAVLKCLRPDPRRRYGSAGALMAALQQAA